MILSNDKTMQVLTKAIEAASIRQQAIANNIANINTRNYKANRVTFEDELNYALNAEKGASGIKKVEMVKTHPNHYGIDSSGLDSVQARVVKDESTSMRLDGNNVDIDVEAANLAANQLLYEALLRRVNGKISSIKSVIAMGR